MTSQALQTKEGAWLSRSLFSELPRDLCPWLDVQGTHYCSLSPSSADSFLWARFASQGSSGNVWRLLGCQNCGGGHLETRNAAGHPTTRRTAPYKGIIQPQRAIVLTLKKPCLGATSKFPHPCAHL